MSEDNRTISLFDPKRLIGQTHQVSVSSVKVALLDGCNIDESPYQAQIGDNLIISSVGSALYVRVIDILRTGGSEQKDLVLLNLELLATIKVENGKLVVSPGVARYPDIGAKAYLAHPKLVQHVAESQSLNSSGQSDVALQLAYSVQGTETSLSVTPERLFGRHCAVLGTSGSGKSWTLARLLEESSRHKSKIILFDATGEFFPLKGRVRHVYLGQDPSPRSGSIQVCLPYYQLKEIDLYAIFRPQGQSQPSKLRSAMKTLKLAQLSPQLAYGGTVVKAFKEKKHYDQEYRRYYNEIENPLARFDISRLSQQIENECIFPNRGSTETNFWGGPNGQEVSDCVSLINRIDDVVRSPDLASLFQPNEAVSLFDEIEDFLHDNHSSVLRISLQYLSFAYGAREVVANAIGRYLLERARESAFRQNPLVIFLDEAHQFLNSDLVMEGSIFSLDSFALLAKEGRKYSTTLCIATQRPRDIPEGVLSQIGTLLVHRLINHYDRQIIERATGEANSSGMQAVPSLASGEAVIFGVDYPVPLRIKISPPENKPDSKGPDYQSFWR